MPKALFLTGLSCLVLAFLTWPGPALAVLAVVLPPLAVRRALRRAADRIDTILREELGRDLA